VRTWGRIGNTGQWHEITTDVNGYNDAVWITTLAQVLLLNRGESPFFGNYGIPAEQSVITQLFPDWYVAETQGQFAGYFAALSVRKIPEPYPRYEFDVTTNQGYRYPGIEVPI
jgi:hypothetical protein